LVTVPDFPFGKSVTVPDFQEDGGGTSWPPQPDSVEEGVRNPLICVAALALAACSAPSGDPADPASNRETGVSANRSEAPAPVQPPPPGTAGGLSDDRTPVSEAPFAATSAQGAANVVQTYYGLLEAGRFGEAWRLWSGSGESSAMTETDFAASFVPYREYHAQIGAPGVVEGAAGSSYVEVPVVHYGRMKDGRAFSRKAVVTLRRVNDVPGSSVEQRRWHIQRIEESGS
jgi:hypothetical protein